MALIPQQRQTQAENARPSPQAAINGGRGVWPGRTHRARRQLAEFAMRVLYLLRDGLILSCWQTGAAADIMTALYHAGWRPGQYPPNSGGVVPPGVPTYGREHRG